ARHLRPAEGDHQVSYFLIDDSGNASDLATNTGLEVLRSKASSEGCLAKLLETGQYDDVAPLAAELSTIAPEVDLSHLHGHVTLSDGIIEDDDEPDDVIEMAVCNYKAVGKAMDGLEASMTAAMRKCIERTEKALVKQVRSAHGGDGF